MTISAITTEGVQAACAEPYATVQGAAGMAELLAHGGWDVHPYDPPVAVVDRPGELLVASVYSAAGELVGTITYRPETR